MKFERQLAGFVAPAVLLCLSFTAATSQASSGSATPGSSPPQATLTTRVLGTITATEANTITVKSDAGVEQKVILQDATRMLQTAPGQTNLAGATAIHAQDLQVGDRISARGEMNSEGALNAVSLIAMKQADVQKKREADREEWKQHGVGGVVRLVDPATGAITVATGSGTTAKSLIVQVSKSTVIRRYAPGSAKLADAAPATISQVKPGDEIQARGTRAADATEMSAVEVVAGSFRNLAGTITAVDRSAGTISLTDLSTKKPYVISCTADSQLRKLPPAVAQMLAARLKGQTARPAAASRPAAATVDSAANGSAVSAASPASSAAVSQTPGASGSEEHRGSGDPQHMLSLAPAIQLTDLQKGDVVMVVTTEGAAPGVPVAGSGNAVAAASVTAITLIAGVEPMLQASASGSQGLLSSSWSLGSGTPGGEASQ